MPHASERVPCRGTIMLGKNPGENPGIISGYMVDISTGGPPSAAASDYSGFLFQITTENLMMTLVGLVQHFI